MKVESETSCSANEDQILGSIYSYYGVGDFDVFFWACFLILRKCREPLCIQFWTQIRGTLQFSKHKLNLCSWSFNFARGRTMCA